MNVGINEDVAAASFLNLHDNSIEYFDKQVMVTNIESEAILPSIKKYLFHQCMVDFLNKLDLTYQKTRLMEM